MRESKSGFVVDNGVVKEVIGYSCANPGTPFGNPDHWWCPSVGFSTSSFFDSKEKALEKAKEECLREVKNWRDKLDKIEQDLGV